MLIYVPFVFFVAVLYNVQSSLIGFQIGVFGAGEGGFRRSRRAFGNWV